MMDINGKYKTSRLNKVSLYKAQMEEISFMAEHLEDVPEIFDVYSEKCKLYLIKIFTVLNPNFHYLSLLGKDRIGHELAKAASILQIYPSYHKSSDIFQNMNEDNIHGFWMRFFKLCKMHHSHSISQNEIKIETFQSIFYDLNKAVCYFNYDISIINPKKLKGIDINKEIKSWIPSSLVISMSDDSIKNVSQDEASHEKHQININIDKLISDINYIKKKDDFENLKISKPTTYSYESFFISFNQSVNVVKIFKDSIDVVSSFNLPDIIHNTKLHKESYWLKNNCQVERCNNIIQNILLKSQFDN